MTLSRPTRILAAASISVLLPIGSALDALAASCNLVSQPLPRPGLSPALSAAPPYTCAVNYYVDAIHGNDANPGTQAQPWATIQNADNGWPNVPKAGECVNVLPGTYMFPHSVVISHGGNRNSSTGYVVYRSTVPQAAHLVAMPGINAAANGDMFMIWAPYIIIDGFNIDGNHALANGNGIDGCASGGAPYNIAHHFLAINNIIHDLGGAGLSTCTADYITWQNNVIYNTSSTNQWQVSAVDIWEPKALASGSYVPTSADTVPYGITVAYNIVHDNAEGPTIPGGHTDGNGIIIDTTLGSAKCSTCGVAYPGQILVIGNVAYHNGGGGIHVFLSKNVTVANNTVYSNYLDPRNSGTARGELSNGGSANITWVNNLAYAVPGSGYLGYNSPIISFPVGSDFLDSGTWLNNLAYGAPVASDARSYVNPSTNLIGVAPMLTDAATADFVPLAGSPVIGAGHPESYIPVAVPNIGAY